MVTPHDPVTSMSISISQRCPPAAGATALAGAETAPARKVGNLALIACHPDKEGVIT